MSRPIACFATSVTLLMGSWNALADSGAAASPGALDLASLLGRLAEHETQIARFNRTRHTSTDQELDSKGAVTDEAVTVMEVTVRGDRRDVVVRHSTHNGKDETREHQEAFDKPGKDAVHLSAKSPFKPAEQPNYNFQLFPPEAGADLLRIHFVPKAPAKADQMIGDAWVDPNLGVVVRISSVPAKLPEHADTVKMRLEYQATTPVGPALSKLVVDAEASFLFFHQRMRSTLVIDDYQIAEP